MTASKVKLKGSNTNSFQRDPTPSICINSLNVTSIRRQPSSIAYIKMRIILLQNNYCRPAGFNTEYAQLSGLIDVSEKGESDV